MRLATNGEGAPHLIRGKQGCRAHPYPLTDPPSRIPATTSCQARPEASDEAAVRFVTNKTLHRLVVGAATRLLVQEKERCRGGRTCAHEAIKKMFRYARLSFFLCAQEKKKKPEDVIRIFKTAVSLER